jgi:hypothetical protein
LTIDDDPQYSQPYAKRFDRRDWICPLVLDNANTTRTKGQYVHFVEKAVGPSTDVEWALRPYNQTNPTRHSRLSFHTFNLGSPAGGGNGSYMEYGVSSNDGTPIELGKWVFVAGEAETVDFADRPDYGLHSVEAGRRGEAGVEAKRVAADKYFEYKVHPQHGSGPITVGGTQTTGLKGAIAHLAL